MKVWYFAQPTLHELLAPYIQGACRLYHRNINVSSYHSVEMILNTYINVVISGVYVKLRGSRDPRCSVMVANYVSCLDSLAASHVLGTISVRIYSLLFAHTTVLQQEQFWT